VPKYAALTERRLVLTTPDVEDGVTISTTALRSDAAVVTSRPDQQEGAVGVAIEPPLRLATQLPQPVSELTLEIRDTNPAFQALNIRPQLRMGASSTPGIKRRSAWQAETRFGPAPLDSAESWLT
jgi:hypothetical protein